MLGRRGVERLKDCAQLLSRVRNSDVVIGSAHPSLPVEVRHAFLLPRRLAVGVLAVRGAEHTRQEDLVMLLVALLWLRIGR